MRRVAKSLVMILILSMVVSCSQGPLVKKQPEVRNIIFMIGDGMGLAQVYAAMTANKGTLNLERCPYVGLHKTYSANYYITDSAAGATAFSTGKKTNNGMLGMSPDSVALPTILEMAEKAGLATGLISTSAVTHATPAAFIDHQAGRDSYEDIAADFLKTDVDVVIGGGWNHFTKRADGRNLALELKKKGYRVLHGIDSLDMINRGKLACFTADEHNPRVSQGRGDMLPRSVVRAVDLLSQNRKGFFLMVEGSEIDWGGHDNDLTYVVEETMDFDKAIGKALDFAKKEGHTLVVITADHETGGLALTGGNITTGEVIGCFALKDHTAVMVPVFAYGPGAEKFTGIFENTDFFTKFCTLLGLD